MGLYDIFSGKCPFCNADYVGQTKFFVCEMLTFEVGNFVSDFIEDIRLDMKEQCPNCKKYPVVIIKNHRFVGFEKDNATYKEGNFRTLLQYDEELDNRGKEK